MGFFRNLCLNVVLCVVVVSALGINDVSHTDTNNLADAKSQEGAKKQRFMDFDGIFSSMTNGMDYTASHSSQGSSFVKKVTQSHGTLGGQSVVKTEITEITGNNPVGMRFKRDLFGDLMEKVEKKAESVKNTLAGAVADGVNLAQSVHNTVKEAINRRYNTED